MVPSAAEIVASKKAILAKSFWLVVVSSRAIREKSEKGATQH
jgi:hypothetical protein